MKKVALKTFYAINADPFKRYVVCKDHELIDIFTHLPERVCGTDRWRETLLKEHELVYHTKAYVTGTYATIQDGITLTVVEVEIAD